MVKTHFIYTAKTMLDYGSAEMASKAEFTQVVLQLLLQGNSKHACLIGDANKGFLSDLVSPTVFSWAYFLKCVHRICTSYAPGWQLGVPFCLLGRAYFKFSKLNLATPSPPICFRSREWL